MIYSYRNFDRTDYSPIKLQNFGVSEKVKDSIPNFPLDNNPFNGG